MNLQILPAAVVSPTQIRQMSHLLAAANHRQWILWEHWVLRDPALLATDAGVSAIIESAATTEFEELLTRNAATVLNIVRKIAGDFAYKPDIRPLIERKREQFRGWVEYAGSQAADKRTRWLLQCRTPFLALPPAMQASDYTEATQDLLLVAEAGGLVLTEPQPAFKPQTDRHIRRLRRRHALGMHGSYVDSEQPWSCICLGCHRNWSVTP